MSRSLAAMLCAVAWAVGCSGSVETLGPGGTGGDPSSGGAHSGGAASGGAETGGAPSAGGGFGVGATAGSGAGGYVDPGCPDVPPPDPYYECDPLEPHADCIEGMACTPFVSHPYGTGCGTQQFGALCVFAGTGLHGAICGDGNERCAPGYLCVVGANAGKRCAQLCPLTGDHECPDGLICGETDIVGYGVCH